MSKSDPLGVRQHDPVQKWRDQMDALEEERERARRREERELRQQQRAAEATARDQAFEARLSALEAQNRELTGSVLEIAQASAQAINDIVDICETLDQRDEVAKLKAAIKTKTRAHEQTFRFARERPGTPPADMPNFLPKRNVN